MPSSRKRPPSIPALGSSPSEERGQAGGTILCRLKELYPDSSTTSLREWLAQGRVRVEGRVIRDPRTRVQPEQQVELARRAVVASLRSGASLGIPILYRDPHLVIIDKPAGLLSVAAAYEREECAASLLQNQLRGEVLPVHRLDRETSGVLCFARTPEAQARLKELFAAHDLQRQYVAVVEGHLPQQQGTWSCWLREDPVSYQVHVCAPEREGSQRAMTHYRVLEEGPSRSLLELTLETGRKHQIRVHCATAGTPVVGDPRYGQEGERLALHAELLALRHPIFHEKVEAHSPRPKWMIHALKRRVGP